MQKCYIRETRNMKNKEAHYGLLTATTMIIGIVIGSGIFFRSSQVLDYTGGSVGLGVLTFCIAALSIIFGSLTLTELSVRTDKNGGVVGYFEDFLGNGIASGFGWFQTFVYFPALNAVISWVAAIYTCSLFGLNASLGIQILIGLGYMVIFYALNMLSLKAGGYFQNITTVVKLIPLLIIAFAGLFWGAPHPALPSGVTAVAMKSVGFGWLAALAPIAFSFDGWIVAVSITNEVKNPKKNMPRALAVGPLIVLGVYLLYFIGLNKMLGPQYIMSTGNDAINKVGQLLFGGAGAKIILTFVVISILGVLNGLILGTLRMPQALASKNMIPSSEKIAPISPKYNLSVGSFFVAFGVSVLWVLLNYLTQKSGVLGTGDVSEIAIVFSYVCYAVLYVRVLKMRKEKIVTSRFKGLVSPILGLIGSAIILIGGIISDPVYAPIFIAFCLVVCLIGYVYYRRRASAGGH